MSCRFFPQWRSLNTSGINVESVGEPVIEGAFDDRQSFLDDTPNRRGGGTALGHMPKRRPLDARRINIETIAKPVIERTLDDRQRLFDNLPNPLGLGRDRRCRTGTGCSADRGDDIEGSASADRRSCA